MESFPEFVNQSGKITISNLCNDDETIDLEYITKDKKYLILIATVKPNGSPMGSDKFRLVQFDTNMKRFASRNFEAKERDFAIDNDGNIYSSSAYFGYPLYKYRPVTEIYVTDSVESMIKSLKYASEHDDVQDIDGIPDVYSREKFKQLMATSLVNTSFSDSMVYSSSIYYLLTATQINKIRFSDCAGCDTMFKMQKNIQLVDAVGIHKITAKIPPFDGVTVANHSSGNHFVFSFSPASIYYYTLGVSGDSVQFKIDYSKDKFRDIQSIDFAGKTLLLYNSGLYNNTCLYWLHKND